MQPGKKERRRNARIVKAKRLAPRPVNALHPVVRAQTIKYNQKVRAGRGFTFDELKAAGVKKKEARGVGIAVDHRRKNRSQEAFKNNVERLKLYLSKLVVFPTRAARKKAKGDSKTQEELKQVKQVLSKQVLPITFPVPHVKARKATKEERAATVTAILRKALTDHKLAGAREKRAKDKAAGLLPKGGKKGGKGGEEAPKEAEDAEEGGEE